MSIVKTVTRRDSATAILRKIGIKPRDYNLFIAEIDDGKFAVRVEDAEKHLKALVGPSEEEVAKQAALAKQAQELRAQLETKVKTTKVVKARKQATVASRTVNNPITEGPKDGESCSSYSRRMILAGHNNAELWAALVEHFNLDEKKRGYPAWYRFQMRKAGEQV